MSLHLLEAFGEFEKDQSFDFQVAASLNSLWERNQTFFSNPDVDSGSTPETLWPVGGVITFPTTAGVTQVVSDSAADAAAGTGARTVLVTGLDSNYMIQTETVTLNGITAVTLTRQFLRVNYMTVVTAGSGKRNAGLITCTINDGSPKTVHAIQATYNRSNCAIFTVPADYEKGYLIHLFLNPSRAGTGYIDFSLYAESSTLKSVVTNYSVDFAGTSFIDRELIKHCEVFEPRTDVYLQAEATSANNVAVNGRWTFYCVRV